MRRDNPISLSGTPTEFFATCWQEPGAVLLETQKSTPRERYSFIARAPRRALVPDRAHYGSRYFEELEAATREGFCLGYLGYDLRLLTEELPDRSPALLSTPDAWMGVYDSLLCYDHLTRRWYTRGSPELSSGARRTLRGSSPGQLRLHRSREDYLQAIKRAQAYIAAGDVYQVNLTQPILYTGALDPWALYLRLREVQPVPYAAFLNLGEERYILSGSPELFLRVRDGVIVSKPMKGTRPRGRTSQQDRHLRLQLRESQKDRAENVMIVDLMRHDLGKVAEIGTVSVPRLFRVEGYRTVYQMISEVTAKLRPGVGVAAVLKACFPPGSVTGAPKKRACEIIDELEGYRRGVYTGAIGILTPEGGMTFNVAIRTLAVMGSRACLGVGGAILGDSDPVEEYHECLVKAAAFLRALGVDDRAPLPFYA
ncbi:MAG: aminodeoxychorismate synthase component I [Candidatus Methylomirabilales bacterium]